MITYLHQIQMYAYHLQCEKHIKLAVHANLFLNLRGETGIQATQSKKLSNSLMQTKGQVMS